MLHHCWSKSPGAKGILKKGDKECVATGGLNARSFEKASDIYTSDKFMTTTFIHYALMFIIIRNAKKTCEVMREPSNYKDMVNVSQLITEIQTLSSSCPFLTIKSLPSFVETSFKLKLDAYIIKQETKKKGSTLHAVPSGIEIVREEYMEGSLTL